MEGVQRRYQQVTKEVMERLEYELSVIDRMGYNDYFLIVWDLVQFAKNNQIGMVDWLRFGSWKLGCLCT